MFPVTNAFEGTQNFKLKSGRCLQTTASVGTRNRQLSFVNGFVCEAVVIDVSTACAFSFISFARRKRRRSCGLLEMGSDVQLNDGTYIVGKK